MHKKHIYILIVIIIVLIFCAVASTIFFIELSKQSGLIVTLFDPELQKASDEFYSEYLDSNPIVYSYSGKIINLKRNEKGYYIKFAIQPVLGPHFPVGDDEVEYYVSYSGTITQLNYSHKKNYDIPSRVGTIKKPIPLS